tara:strand:- start:1180 stop:2196 length:1017 start_codon:yes stop_codon:yes gene_type:complete
MASGEVAIHIYVIHYTELTERKACVDSLLSFEDPVNKIHVHMIKENDPNDIDMGHVRQMIDVGPYPEDQNPIYKQFVRPFSMNILSNSLKHMNAIVKASTGGANDYHVILEDDVVFSSNIVLQIRSLINGLRDKSDWDVIMLGQPSSTMATTNNAEVIPLGKDYILPCCESYMLSSRSAKLMKEKMLPIRFSTNVQLSYLFDRFEMKAFKVFPNIVGDGSKMGTYVSSVQPNNVLIFNNTFKEIYTLLSKGDDYLLPADSDHIVRLLESNEFKTNPDIMHMEGLFYKTKGDYLKAVHIFERAMQIYKENHAVVNNNSIFLRNYIDCYKKLQDESLSVS